MKSLRMFVAAVAAAGVLITGAVAIAADHEATEAVAVLTATEGNEARGTVHFKEMNGKIKIHAEVKGLKPGADHAIHIHQWGDCSSADGKATGGHYNPEGHDHGLPSGGAKRHAGDLGNLKADDKGVAVYSIEVDNISISGAKNPILGRGVIVHAGADDGGQPTGNAGGRIAQGVIGLADPQVRLSGGGGHSAPATAAGKTILAEAGCAKCGFAVAGVTKCTNAVKVDGKVLTLEGGGLSHGKVCQGTKPVELTGEIKGDKFVATQVTLK